MRKYKDKKLFSLERLIGKIKEENKNQINKWGVQERTAFEWITYAMEELGELACEITEYEYHRKDNRNDIVKEAIQTATLILKIAELFLNDTEQQDWQPNKMQNGFIEEKVDKLEKARKFEMKYAEKMYYYTVDVMHKIELYKQAIEQIIKEKEDIEYKYKLEKQFWDRNVLPILKYIQGNSSRFKLKPGEDILKYIYDNLNNFQQKKPPRKCIEWLKRYDCSKCAKELLEYFEEN